MILEAREPLEINIDGDVYQLDTGQAFTLPDDRAKRARPFIEEGILKEVEPVTPPTKGLLPPIDPKETLDRFWSQDILPRLSRLHMAGRLPDLATCPGWNEVDRLWDVPKPDVAKVKAVMTKALEAYEASDHLF